MRFYTNYQEYREAWNNADNKTPSIPINLDIELSTVCNLQCPFCFTTEKTFNKKSLKNYINTETAIKLIKEASGIGIPSLKFNWRGESTLHPDFNDIIKFAHDQKTFHDIIINTNGNIPDKSIKGLLYTTKVIVSLDAFDKHIYEEMRSKGDVRTVLNTVDDLVAKGHKNIIARRILTNTNRKENFTKMVYDRWFGKVEAYEHYCFDRNINGNYQINKEKHRQRIYCGYPSRRLIISTDENFYPCCVDYYGKMELGNYTTDHIMKIWNGEKINTLREILKKNIFLDWMEPCKNCTSFMAYDCIEKNNLLVNIYK
jgi:radical SAM protein with 4Fe4S-binding SPASM domain